MSLLATTNFVSFNSEKKCEADDDHQQFALNMKDMKKRGRASLKGGRPKGRFARKTAFKIAASMKNYQNVFLLVTIFLLVGLGSVDSLKCYMCGQYNEGVGSITPCLSYSEKNASLYLKECSKKSEKFCVKYVSELSTVRDCATECIEKEVWETNTYCCGTDGCNGSNNMEISMMALMLPLMYLVVTFVANLKSGKMWR